MQLQVAAPPKAVSALERLQADSVPSLAAGSGARGRRSKGAVRGANHGQLLPGEKRKLKRAAVDGKRAARAAAHGLDLRKVNEELELFVAHRGDMKVGSVWDECCLVIVKMQLT